VYATIPRPEEINEYYYDEDAELSMVLYNGLLEIDTAFYPSVVANFNVTQKDIMYTTQVGLSAIIIKVTLTDELFLKVYNWTARSTVFYFVIINHRKRIFFSSEFHGY